MGKKLTVKYKGELLSEISPEIPENGIITVGNDASATIELKDESIAPEQFVLVCEPSQIILMCRVDGTNINGENVAQGTIHNLQNSDLVTIGDYSFALESDEASDPPTIEPTLPEITESPEIHESKSERTLTDVLQSLRSEEKFYFQIVSSKVGTERLFVETDEFLLGRNQEGNVVLTIDEKSIESPAVPIRKDWSGVVAYPPPTGKVWLDNEILTAPHRLKNDDTLYLQASNSLKPDLETVIKFHEPTALLVLDSILPKELPPPISLEEAGNSLTEFSDENDLETSQIPAKTKSLPKKMYFGYFTLTEIFIMIVGTMITAAIIYLVLEFY